jgi:transcriptional regulator with XRE-family HTH domain
VIGKFVDKNLMITEQVFQYLRDLGWTQKELAARVGKSEAEISKWLSGAHNLTLKSLAKLELALGEDVITTPSEARQKYERVRFVRVTVNPSVNEDVSPEGFVEIGSRNHIVNLRRIA